MKNEYEVCGEITFIHLRKRSGEIIKTIIDTEDLLIVNSISGAWCGNQDARTGSYYVHSRNRSKKTKFCLHRLIMGDPEGLEIDHINRDTLDNRKVNLRSVSRSVNRQNLAVFSNNKSSGVRNVSWHVRDKNWQVCVNAFGKAHYFGRFNTLEEAELIAIEARRQLHAPDRIPTR